MSWAAAEDADTVLNAVVGMVGLRPTLAAIAAGNEVALANKETLVAGGGLVTRRVAELSGRACVCCRWIANIRRFFSAFRGLLRGKALPVDFDASGGPFFGKKREELAAVTLSDALRHPNWSMGAKITIDSATMINKGLELIEARWLFDMPADKIDIVVHRESVVHSLVEYEDHSVIAQLGVPDMRIPIQYALTYPDRVPSPVRQLRLEEWGKLTFYPPDEETFEGIALCRAAVMRGGAATVMVNAANEEAVLCT